jgi:hypothetical protein
VSVSCSNDEDDKLRRNYGCQIGSNDHFHYCIAYFSDSVILSQYRPLCTFLGRNKGRFTHSMPCPCRSPAMPCRKGFRICLSHLIYTVRPCLIHNCHASPIPCRSFQGHGTARPSRDGLWATCPRSASSGYQAEFHEDCYQKHTSPPHNDPYLRL